MSLPMPEERILAVQGKLAENLRRSTDYRQCQQIFVDPSLLLRQVRVNALLDGKELIMPGAGLKEGFYLLKPYQIPFKSLIMGVTYTGLERYGCRLTAGDISALDITLLLGESFAVDRQGGRLGDGQGFFDLAVALLGELDGLAPDCQVIGAIDDPAKVVGHVPREAWDVRCAKILTADGLEELAGAGSIPKIFWDDIPAERIKRISPLRRLLASRQ